MLRLHSAIEEAYLGLMDRSAEEVPRTVRDQLVLPFNEGGAQIVSPRWLVAGGHLAAGLQAWPSVREHVGRILPELSPAQLMDAVDTQGGRD